MNNGVLTKITEQRASTAAKVHPATQKTGKVQTASASIVKDPNYEA
jgi:hypothetical protein